MKKRSSLKQNNYLDDAYNTKSVKDILGEEHYKEHRNSQLDAHAPLKPFSKNFSVFVVR